MSRADPSRRRVLVVAPQPFYEDRGTPIAVRQVLKALSQLGIATDVLTYPMGQSPAIPGVRYYRVANPLRLRAVPIGFSARKVWLDLFLFAKLQSLLRRHHYRCIHAVEEAAFLAVLAARRRGIPVIYDMQSSIPEQLAKRRLLGSPPGRLFAQACEGWLIRQASRIVCSAGLAGRVRRAAPDALVSEWQFPSWTPTPIAPDMRLRARLGLREGERVVLYTGNFEDYQGTSLLVESMPDVLSRVPDAVFVLVGANGDEASNIAEQLARIAPARSHRLLPRQPREAMPAFLKIADIVVSPRIRGSNLPLKALEYLAAGCAIVATSIPAHRAVIDENLAVLVEPTSHALGEAIADLLQNPNRAERLRVAARRYAEENLSWIGFVKSVGELYAGIELRD